MRGSRFLNKAVQGHEVVLVKANQYARRAISWQVCSHFPQTFSHRTAKRHAHRPTPLGPQQISPDRMALCLLQSFNPFSQSRTGSLPALVRKKTSGIFCDASSLGTADSSVPYKVHYSLLRMIMRMIDA